MSQYLSCNVNKHRSRSHSPAALSKKSPPAAVAEKEVVSIFPLEAKFGVDSLVNANKSTRKPFRETFISLQCCVVQPKKIPQKKLCKLQFSFQN